MAKKLISVLLSVLLVLGTVTVSAFASDESDEYRQKAAEWLSNPVNSVVLGYYSAELVEETLANLPEMYSNDDFDAFLADYAAAVDEARAAAFADGNEYIAVKTEAAEIAAASGFSEEKIENLIEYFDAFVDADYNGEEQLLLSDSKYYRNRWKEAESPNHVGEEAVLARLKFQSEGSFILLVVLNSEWKSETEYPIEDVNLSLVCSQVLFDDSLSFLEDYLIEERYYLVLTPWLDLYGDFSGAINNISDEGAEERLTENYIKLRYALKAGKEKADNPKKTPGYVKEVTYTPSANPTNTYAVKVEGRPSMIQFYDSHAGTRSFDRNSTKVLEIRHYDADGNEVGDLSRNIAYEVWTVKTVLEEDTYIVRAKGSGESKWESVTDETKELYTFENKYAAPDARFISVEAPESGKKGAVVINVTAEGADIERITVVNEGGDTVTGTLANGRIVRNEDGTVSGSLKGWASHDGVNTITVKLYAAGKWVEEQTVTYIVGNIGR